MTTENKKYDKFYFMHYPRTGGRYILHNVINPIQKYFDENNIRVIKTRGHDHWHSEIDDNTYIVHTLRDPVTQLMSALHSGDRKLSEEGFDSLIEILSTKNKNIQTITFFCNEDDLIQIPKILSREFLLNNMNLVQEKMDRINLLLDMKDISGKHLEIQKKILLDLGINAPVIDKPIVKSFFNQESKNAYDRLTHKQKEKIKQFLDIDEYLYTNAKFWRP